MNCIYHMSDNDLKKYAYQLLNTKIDIESRFSYLFYEITKNLYLEYRLSEMNKFTENQEKGIWEFLGRKEFQENQEVVTNEFKNALKVGYEQGKDQNILKEKLRETGFKITPQRRAVIDILLKHNSEHLSSEQIYDLVRVDCPEIGLATVYRTMQLLDEIGVISKLNLDDGCIRYEISLNKNECHNHHHLICKNCSKIIEVQEDLLESIESKIQERYKFDIVDHDVKFYGLCEDCKK